MTHVDRLSQALSQLNADQLDIIEKLLASWDIKTDAKADEATEKTTSAEDLMKNFSPIQPAKDSDMNDLERVLGRKF
ncbi:MAG: hypothetical protein Q4A67_00815 [Aerococcus sp.]|nr:hypothetical protein [Aerococcus sp.]